MFLARARGCQGGKVDGKRVSGTAGITVAVGGVLFTHIADLHGYKLQRVTKEGDSYSGSSSQRRAVLCAVEGWWTMW